MTSDENGFFLEKYRLDRAQEVALNNATAAYEHASLRMLLILNGGSATAFVALFGAKNQNESILDPKFVLLAILTWLLGVLIAGFATFEAYRGQSRFTSAYRRRRQAAERRMIADDEKAKQIGLPAKGDDVLSDQQIDLESDQLKAQGRRYADGAKVLGGYSLVFFVLGTGFAILSMQRLVPEILALLGQ